MTRPRPLSGGVYVLVAAALAGPVAALPAGREMILDIRLVDAEQAGAAPTVTSAIDPAPQPPSITGKSIGTAPGSRELGGTDSVRALSGNKTSLNVMRSLPFESLQSVDTGTFGGGASPTGTVTSGAPASAKVDSTSSGVRRAPEGRSSPAARSSRGGSGRGLGSGMDVGLVNAVTSLPSGYSITLLPHWPGGHAPATVDIDLEIKHVDPVAGASIPPSASRHVATTVTTAPGRWTTFAAIGGPAEADGRQGGSTSSVPTDARQVFQIRVRAP